MSGLHTAVVALLDGIPDPCSVRLGRPRGLVGMGLVESVTIDEDIIRVGLVLTSPLCAYYFQFADDIRRALVPVAGGREIDVVIDDSVMWTPDRLRIHAMPIHPA